MGSCHCFTAGSTSSVCLIMHEPKCPWSALATHKIANWTKLSSHYVIWLKYRAASQYLWKHRTEGTVLTLTAPLTIDNINWFGRVTVWKFLKQTLKAKLEDKESNDYQGLWWSLALIYWSHHSITLFEFTFYFMPFFLDLQTSSRPPQIINRFSSLRGIFFLISSISILKNDESYKK